MSRSFILNFNMVTIAGMCNMRFASDWKRTGIRKWRRRAQILKMVRASIKTKQHRMQTRVFHLWLRFALYQALARKARHVMDSVQHVKVSEFASRRAHFVRVFRASFYLWRMATAVMYEARAQRAKALRRIILHACRQAFSSWIYCVEKARKLEQSTVRALHAANTIKHRQEMLIPVPSLFRKV